MKFKKRIITVVILSMSLLGYSLLWSSDHEEHDDHAGHDHAKHAAPDAPDAHGDEGEAVELSSEEIQAIGLKTAVAGPGVLGRQIHLAGEIQLNQDRISHLVPAVPGIVRETTRKLGDRVKAGDILAWLESADLGQMKMDYLGKWTEMSCCALDLARAQQISDSTARLLKLLADSPSLETLQNAEGIEMGDNLSKLISTYAEVSLAQATYEREKPLFEQKISSEEEFLQAQNAFKKANAQYVAARDSIAFEVKRNLLEANQERKIQTMALKNSQRQLKILGLTDATIQELEQLAGNQNVSGAKEQECNDPDCTECALESEVSKKKADELAAAETKLAWYPLIAPFDGTIIEKHIVLGERVGPESTVYVIADLSSVWVQLQVYPRDLRFIKKGQSVVVTTDSVTADASGVISYVGPVVGTESRTVLARVVLSNESGAFRPGLFVTAKAALESRAAQVVVPKNAIQSLEGKKCVFIKDEHGFEPVYVKLGLEMNDQVEILSGLASGQEYVIEGAFTLKSKIVTSTLDSHAGHGH
jgi:cobalt-zinc-cadmium efflux system membrane fusion protein